MDRALHELDVAYKLIERLHDIVEFRGPLHLNSVYQYTTSESYTSAVSLLYSNIDKLPTSVANPAIEVIRGVKTSDTAVMFSCLYAIYGEKILSNIPLITRLQILSNSDLTTSHEYSSSFFSAKSLDSVKYGREIMRKIFSALSLIDNIHTRSHRTYGLAELMMAAYKDSELPIAIPANLAQYSSVRKAYLRYIMHNPNDEKYVSAFNHIFVTCDTHMKRVLYYFAHSIGGIYKPLVAQFKVTTTLSQWYGNELTEKQLDTMFDDVLRDEKRTFDELLALGIGISLDANIRLTKKRFAKIQKHVESKEIAEFKELAGPFMIKDSCMLACKILRRQIND
jgi:hypothetical protein